ncbi:MAG: CYTH domain-containing protein [Chloroflexi bacterium]|nr:MAG: CYTH domain-containing protein [Chloroflexota bacterium]
MAVPRVAVSGERDLRHRVLRIRHAGPTIAGALRATAIPHSTGRAAVGDFSSRVSHHFGGLAGRPQSTGGRAPVAAQQPAPGALSDRGYGGGLADKYFARDVDRLVPASRAAASGLHVSRAAGDHGTRRCGAGGGRSRADDGVKDDNDNKERELKLVPADEGLLDRLEAVERLGELGVRGRRRELQRNSFFDTRSRALSRARVGFRRRTIAGERMATWTLKADSKLEGGVATRLEIELQLDADLAPALAIGVLRDAARSRGASALAEAVSDALRSDGLPLARPYVETETDRRILDLEAPARGWKVELALDCMRLLGHDYADVEIEAELKRGDLDALEAARQAMASLGEVRPSEASKLSRALAHLASCNCAPSPYGRGQG